MAIVGEALVRVRVLSSGLSRDIANNVREGFRGASGDFDREGRNAGRRMSQGAAEGSNDSQSTSRWKRASRKIGDTFSEGMREGFTKTFKNKVAPAMRNAVRDGTRRAFSRTGNDIANSISIKDIVKRAKKVSDEFGRNWNLGIGRARMGKAIISALALAAPSVLSGAAALGTALGGQLVIALARMGPAIAGAGVTLAAGLTTAILNFGLLKAAFAANNKELDAAKKSFKEFTKDLGTPIAANMAAGFQSLGNSLKSLVPQINDLLATTGTRFGEISAKIGETITRADNLARIRGILQTNNEFLGQFKEGIGGITTGILILVDAFKPFNDMLGEAVANFGNWLEKTLSAKEASGELSSFMNGLVDAFKRALEVITDWSVAIFNVFRAAGDASVAVGNLGERFRAWTEDSGNRDRMIAFFEKANTLSSALGRLLGQLASAAAGAFENMDPGPLLAVLDILGTKIAPALADLWNQVQSGAGQNLVEIFDNLGTALQKISESGAFETISRIVSEVLVIVSELVASDLGATILAWTIPVLLFGNAISGIIGPLITLVGIFSGPIAGIAAIIAGVAAGFVLMWNNSERFREAIGGLVDAVTGPFTGMWDVIGPKVSNLWEKLQELAGIIGDRLAPVIEALTPVVSFFATTFVAAFEYVIDFLAGFIEIISGILTGDWNRVWEGAKSIVQSFWQFLQTVFGGVVSWLGGIFSDIWNSVFEATSNGLAGVRDFIVGVWDGVWAYLEGIWNTIVAGAQGIWSNITTFFSSLWSGITGAFSAVWNGIGSLLSSIWEGIVSGAQSIWNGLVDFFATLWQGVQDVFSTVWNGIVDTLSSIWQGIGDIAIKYFSSPINYIMHLWDGLSNLFSIVWSGISNILSTAWQGISNLASTIWNNITSFISAAWNGLLSIAAAVWNAITTAIGTAIQGAWNLIQSVWNAVSAFLGAVWMGIKVVAATVWSAVTQVIMTAVEGAKNLIQSIWNAVRSFLSGVWSGLQSLASSVWSAITGAISSAVNTAQAVIIGIWNAVSSTLSSIWNGISSTASSIWNGIVSIASSAWNAVVNAITSVVEPVVGFLQGLWDQITGAISSAFDGLSGIVGPAWEAVKNAIVGPIQAAIGLVEAAIGTIVGIVQGAWDLISGIADKITGAVGAATSAVAEATTARNAAQSLGKGVAGLPPGAATGGVFMPTAGGTTIRVAEANKMERVEPLDRLGLSARDRAIIKELAGAGGAGPVSVIVKIGERQLTEIVDTRVVRGMQDQVRQIKNGRRS